jgi:hypothetical protein
LKEIIHFDAEIAMYRAAVTRVCKRCVGELENQIRRTRKGKPKLSIVKSNLIKGKIATSSHISGK